MDMFARAEGGRYTAYNKKYVVSLIVVRLWVT